MFQHTDIQRDLWVFAAIGCRRTVLAPPGVALREVARVGTNLCGRWVGRGEIIMFPLFMSFLPWYPSSK